MKRTMPTIASVIFALLFSHAAPCMESGLVEMKIRRVMLDPSAAHPSPVVILEDVKDKRVVPIWIGNEEAISIALVMESVAVPRPNTHDLIRNILQGVGAALQRITITDVRNNTYYATITLRLKGQEFEIDSRPSDAIAVALRMKAPVYAAPQVLAKAGPLPFAEKLSEENLKMFGLQAQDLTPALASLMDLQVKQGVLVADVELGSPASQAGIQRGDIITKINDRAIAKTAELESLLKGVKKPAQLHVEILRKGQPTTVLWNLPS